MDKNTQRHESVHQDEIISLNIENLDVEELERRLELVAAAPDGGCGVHWYW